MIKLLAKIFIRKRNELSETDMRSKYGVIAGALGIFNNLILFSAKIVIGILSGAVSIVADALNNLSDVASSVVTMLGFKLSNRPKDAKHPFGHGRIEHIGGLIVSLIILLVGVELIKASVERIISPTPLNISIITIIILSCSIVMKLWMFFYNRNIGKEIASAAMKATALDSLNDVIATSVVLICILINYFTNIVIDGYAGILVALFILFGGFKSIKEIISILVGEKPDPKFVQDVADFVMSFQIISGVHDLVVHNYGPGRQMITLHAEVPCDGDFLETHDVIDNIELAIKEKFLCSAVIHMDPIVTNNARISEVKNKIEDIVKNYNEKYTIHDFRMNEGSTHSNLIFDVVTTYDNTLSDEKIISDLNKQIKALNPSYNAFITIDKPFI